MPRLYHVDIARHVAAADSKWIDNLLSHFSIPGVDGGRQGTARRITAEGICHITLVRTLASEVGLSLSAATALARRLLQIQGGDLPITRWVGFRFERRAFEEEIERRIAEGVESVAPARRGRPPADAFK